MSARQVSLCTQEFLCEKKTKIGTEKPGEKQEEEERKEARAEKEDLRLDTEGKADMHVWMTDMSPVIVSRSPLGCTDTR